MTYHAGSQDLRARKAHTCEFCWKPIAPNTMYHRWSGVHEGRWYRGKAHQACNQAMEWLDYDNNDSAMPDIGWFGKVELLIAFDLAGRLEEALDYLDLDLTKSGLGQKSRVELIAHIHAETEAYKVAQERVIRAHQEKRHLLSTRETRLARLLGLLPPKEEALEKIRRKRLRKYCDDCKGSKRKSLGFPSMRSIACRSCEGSGQWVDPRAIALREAKRQLAQSLHTLNEAKRERLAAIERFIQAFRRVNGDQLALDETVPRLLGITPEAGLDLYREFERVLEEKNEATYGD